VATRAFSEQAHNLDDVKFEISRVRREIFYYRAETLALLIAPTFILVLWSISLLPLAASMVSVPRTILWILSNAVFLNGLTWLAWAAHRFVPLYRQISSAREDKWDYTNRWDPLADLQFSRYALRRTARVAAMVGILAAGQMVFLATLTIFLFVRLSRY